MKSRNIYLPPPPIKLRATPLKAVKLLSKSIVIDLTHYTFIIYTAFDLTIAHVLFIVINLMYTSHV